MKTIQIGRNFGWGVSYATVTDYIYEKTMQLVGWKSVSSNAFQREIVLQVRLANAKWKDVADEL